MIKQQTTPTGQPNDQQQYETNEKPAAEKRPFVEPTVSVPADVLEATALFQVPTIQTSIVP